MFLATMGENLNNLVNQVLQSPELRNCIENCLHTNVPNNGPNQNNSFVTTNLQATGSATPATHSVRDELRRLFPSVRPSSSSSYAPIANRGSKRKKVVREKMQFMKEVILLKKPADSRTLTGYKKAKSYEEGYALSAVEFDKSWCNTDIRLRIAQLFQNQLNGIDFEILVPMSGYLVKPKLNDSLELDGCTLSKIFYNKSIYIRPAQPILRSNMEQNYQDALANNITESESQSRSSLANRGSNNNVIDSNNYELDGLEVNSFLHSTTLETTPSNDIFVEPTILNETVLECSEHTSLNEILSILSKSINEENTTFFNIYREDIFNCCIRALRRKSFSPYNKISVIFTDCDNTTEGAIDMGGPQREMFRLILTYLDTSSGLFIGGDNKKFISLNKEALENRHYYEAGRLIALGIVHVGLGPRFFSEVFFTLLSQGSEHINPTINDITVGEIRNEVEMAIGAADLEALRNVILDGSFIRLAGWEIINDFKNKDAMVEDVIKFYVVERCKKSVDQFIEGLETLNVYNYIKQYPEYFIEIFCNTVEGALTLTKLERLFKIKYSEEGSNKRNVESRIVAFWKDYLLDCSENDAEDSNSCSLEEILIFSTGVNLMPPLGFPTEPALKFLHDDTCPYPKGNTCALELYLPTIHVNYDKFKYNMSFGIKNGMVFGYA